MQSSNQLEENEMAEPSTPIPSAIPHPEEHQRLKIAACAVWPRLHGDLKFVKQEILEAAFKRMSKLYAFLKIQLKAEMQWNKKELARQPTDPITPYRSRMELALQVAKTAGWSKSVAKRILNQEVEYICHGKIPVPKQGKHSKVASWITDEGTILAMREYMAHAGEGISVVIFDAFILLVLIVIGQLANQFLSSNGFDRACNSNNQLLE
ncbi:hypothetical protein L873DRAFT_1844813 [Choiromyces venosus 120613-1]|uniref:Uncharacterized protein n=1 Tax=Choiromyces venosus 120613-1 TaxID=1336337 RepID=A0A3N4JGR7_9PEZI|nr:hypothetical protein L873DRAFT_1844813 [Choiromyces venosus 120613-1]